MTATKTARKPYTRQAPIDRAQFVKAWDKGDSVQAIAKSLSITPIRASALARYLRAKGVKLKTFRNTSKIDVKALNALIS